MSWIEIRKEKESEGGIYKTVKSLLGKFPTSFKLGGKEEKKMKINNLLSLICLCSIFSVQVFSQANEKYEAIHQRNTMFLEGLGHGFAYSINYERVVLSFSKSYTTSQIGLSYYRGNRFPLPSFIIPMSLNHSIKLKGNEYIEIGFGKLLVLDDSDLEWDTWIFRLGFRYHFKNDNWLFKIAYTPLYLNKSDFLHWVGFGFGYKF